jgi:hypothetical protein
MTRPDTLGVVQFIHPGKEETRVTKKGFCAWGRTMFPHRRRFMMADADYVDRGGKKTQGRVSLWCEWEAPSHAKRIGNGHGALPQYIHRQAYYEPVAYEGLWDTDPFIFGDRFLYNGCQQHMGQNPRRETIMRRLAPGSLILFGSSVEGGFVLDTALVVGDYIDYPRGEYDVLADADLPDEYWGMGLYTQALIEPTTDSFRLYRGATYGERISGMFSFTPCRPIDEHFRFARPRISLDGQITQSLTQGKKFTEIDSTDALKEVWTDVYQQVIDADCSLAHRVELNPWRIM